MKQHVTLEQILALKTEDDLGFENWDSITYLNTIANIIFNGGVEKYKTFKECCEETAIQMTIGKMLEMLTISDARLNISYIHEDCHTTITVDEYIYYGWGENICDALWRLILDMYDLD